MGVFKLYRTNRNFVLQTVYFKLKIVHSQSYSNKSNMVYFGKVYFDPLNVYLGLSGCIYDGNT